MAKLSFGLPKYEAGMNKLYDEVQHSFHMLDDVLRQFPPRQLIHHGCTRQVSTPRILDTSPRAHESKFTIEADLFLETDALRFRDLLFDLVSSLLNQQKMHTFQIICQTSNATGNSIDGKGRNFWEVYIEALQTIDYRFQVNRFLVNSDTAKQITAVLPTDEQIERAKDVMKAKREEYRAKKHSRRLS